MKPAKHKYTLLSQVMSNIPSYLVSTLARKHGVARQSRTYLRNRLLLARELLADSGSVFVSVAGFLKNLVSLWEAIYYIYFGQGVSCEL
jgi:Na+/H+ antiporter NhaD/arsenite permease-like protein